MAYEQPGILITLPAGIDFYTNGTGKQWRFALLNTDGTAIAPTANGTAVGVRQNRPKAGEATTIMVSGISYVESGDINIVSGSRVTTDATGRAAVVASGNIALGTALEASSATGIVIAVLLGTPVKA